MASGMGLEWVTGGRRDKMSLSYKVAMDLLAEKDDFDFNDLGFVTTVLMDSTSDKRLQKYYLSILKIIMKLDKEKKVDA